MAHPASVAAPMERSRSPARTSPEPALCPPVHRHWPPSGLRVAPCFLVALLLLLLLCPGPALARLRRNFYAQSCPNAETIVARAVGRAIRNNPRVAAQLLRLHFHDCFVQGCDGSVLLDSSGNQAAEKDAEINASLGGFEVVDDIKSQLEAECPETVSCADLLALAARDAVKKTGGPFIPVLTGRRDGVVSFDFSTSSLPKLTGMNGLVRTFRAVGLSILDLIALSGGHTLGLAHCNNVQGRLPPFPRDRMISKSFLDNVTKACIRNNRLRTQNTVALDKQTRNVFDNQYYVNLINRHGLLITDSVLGASTLTKNHVQKFATDKLAFFRQFNKSMLTMSQIDVLTGGRGEIRLNCRVPNDASANN